MAKQSRNEMRKRRHARVRRKVQGNSARPRLNVFRSLNHIYAQVIDDSVGNTLAAASTSEAEIKAKLEGLNKIEQARVIGRTIAARAKEKGVERVVFDRGGYRHHGRVQALAEGAREGGLEF